MIGGLRLHSRLNRTHLWPPRMDMYIRNHRPDLIYGQHIDSMFQTPTTRVWKTLYDQGRLEAPQTFFWERKPPDRNGLHVSLLALNAIDALGPKAASLRDMLSTMGRQDSASVPRVAEYVPRLLDHILLPKP